MALFAQTYEAYSQLINNSPLFWPFIVGSLFIAACIYLTNKSEIIKSPGAFVAWLFPKKIYAHRSTHLDMQFVLVNTLIYGLFFSSWLLSAEVFATWLGQKLEHVFGAPQHIPDGYLWPSIAMTLALFITIDFAFFISHWLQHKIPLLWRFHRVHHSAEVLNPLTAFRQHPFDQLFEGLVVGLATGTVAGIFYYRFFGLAETLGLMSFNLLTFGFFLAGVHLRHSHIRLRYPHWLSRIFISPLQHQVHHSCLQQHRDKNFGGVFAFWDVLFKSLYLPEKDEVLHPGVTDAHENPNRTILDLYFSPFRITNKTSAVSRRGVVRKIVKLSRRTKYELS